jgi:hypothetical protein
MESHARVFSNTATFSSLVTPRCHVGGQSPAQAPDVNVTLVNRLPVVSVRSST